MAVIEGRERHIVGGVDAHKDLARRSGCRRTRPGHRNTILPHDPAGLSSDARLDALLRRASAHRSGSTGSYGAGLLHFMQQAGIAVLEVTTPDKQDRRRRGRTTI